MLPIVLAAMACLANLPFSGSDCLAGWASRVQDTHEISLAAGIEAYQEGALELCVKALGHALEGNLTSKQRAEALYFRGLAYRELGLPGQAALDLTSAIALKNGLSKARLKDAEKHRKTAFREAGIEATGSVVAGDVQANSSRTAVPVPPGRVPVPVEEPRPWVPLTTGSISVGEPPPAPNGGLVPALEKLIPDWP